ncbi:MAG: hypothetical protein ACRDHW_00445 [Ktedonobacteraceae bacterium]
MIDFDNQAQTVRGVRIATFRRCFAEICQGEEPWLPLGDMMHQWFGRYTAYRAELVREPLDLPASMTPEQERWAVWCAGSVEYLCKRAGLEAPAWAMDPAYTLATPWYYAEVEGEEEEAELRDETPEAFAWRGIYCESNPYRNKYEKDGMRKTA